MEFSISKSLLSRENFRGENSKLSRNTAVRAKVMELRGDRGERVAALEARLKVKSVRTRLNNIEYFEFSAKLRGARSRLYRRRFLQVNTRWKALAEIYTMHSFAPFSNLNFFVKNRNFFFAIELMNIH